MAEVNPVNVPINNPPCKIQDIVVFDVKNLESYLDFLSKCTKGNLDYTTQVEQDFKKKLEIIKKLKEDFAEFGVKLGAQTYKLNELDNSIDNQSSKIMKIDEKIVRLDYEIVDIIRVKEEMIEKMSDIDDLKKTKVKHSEEIEKIKLNFNESEKQKKEEFEKINNKQEEHGFLLASHRNSIKLLDSLTFEHSEGIKAITTKLEQQGNQIGDLNKLIKNQNEKMIEMKEEIRDLKKSVAKIDVVDKKLSDLSSHVDFQMNENKKVIDDFTLRLKFMDKKFDEVDGNFEVVQNRFSAFEEKIVSIDGFNEVNSNQIKSKFDEVETKFDEIDINITTFEKSNLQIIDQMLKNVKGVGSDVLPKPEIKKNINFNGDLDVKLVITSDKELTTKKRKIEKKETTQSITNTSRIESNNNLNNVTNNLNLNNTNIRPSFIGGEIKSSGNPKLATDVEKLQNEVTKIKFNNETIAETTKRAVEDINNLKLENERLNKVLKTLDFDNRIGKDLDKPQQELIEAVNNVNSLEEFVYRKELKDSNDEIYETIDDLKQSLEDFKDDILKKLNDGNISQKLGIEGDADEVLSKLIDNNPIIQKIKEAFELTGIKLDESSISGITNIAQRNESNKSKIIKTMKSQVSNIDTDDKQIDKTTKTVVNQSRTSIVEGKAIGADITIKLEDLTKLIQKNQNKNENSIRELWDIIGEGDNSTIKDSLRAISMKLNIVSEKAEKLSLRIDSVTTDVLNKMKMSLSVESERILDEFKRDLKISIGKIEQQLKDKIDRVSLDDMGRKLDGKYAPELKNKIDKKDLKANNNKMIKKIGDLENKISKTLVDTLIDLQMEDAPLILKKGVFGDKCGSCNQYVQDKNNNMSQFNLSQYNASQYMNSPHITTMQNSTMYNNNQGGVTSSINFNSTSHPKNSEIKQLRSIQDSSNKFNTGSYSRILNHANDDNVKEDLKPQIHLRNSGSQKNLPVLPTPKTSNKFNDSVIVDNDESPYKEVLEKRNVNGNHLVMKANKQFEKLAKQNKETNTNKDTK